MSRPKLFSKLLVVLLVLVIIGAAAAFWAVRNNRNPDDSASQQAQSQQQGENPAEIIASLKDYVNKDISLTGTITKLNNQYYLVGYDGNGSSAVLLDFSKSDVDPAKYAFVPEQDKNKKSSPPSENKTVTVRGKVVQAKSDSAPKLLAESVSQ